MLWLRQGKKNITHCFNSVIYPKKRDPVIVFGIPKSGTSVVASLLADRAGFSKTIDIPEIWALKSLCMRRGRMHLSEVVRKYPKPFSRQLIKDPTLSFIFDQVKEVFPSGRFVWVMRHPKENFRSMLNRLGVPGNLSEIDLSTPDMRGRLEWRIAFNGRIQHSPFHHYIDLLCERWTHAVDTYLAHSHEIRLIKYEDFVIDKVGAIERLAQSLALPRVGDISDKIDIQYQPKGKDRGIDPRAFFGEENLARINTHCRTRMALLNYTT